MGRPFWSRGARAREGWANLSREKEEEQERVLKKKKKPGNEKEGSWEKEREKPSRHLSYLLCTPGPRSQLNTPTAASREIRAPARIWSELL